jgi:hypothetical protein
MTDKEFPAEAERRQLAITPVAGDATDRLVAEGCATSVVIAQQAALLK